MSRPTKLSLILNEAYPTTRRQNENPSTNVMEVQEMTQMANFVYSYYMEKVKVMKDYYQVSNIFLVDTPSQLGLQNRYNCTFTNILTKNAS